MTRHERTRSLGEAHRGHRVSEINTFTFTMVHVHLPSEINTNRDTFRFPRALHTPRHGPLQLLHGGDHPFPCPSPSPNFTWQPTIISSAEGLHIRDSSTVQAVRALGVLCRDGRTPRTFAWTARAPVAHTHIAPLPLQQSWICKRPATWVCVSWQVVYTRNAAAARPPSVGPACRPVGPDSYVLGTVCLHVVGRRYEA